MLHYLDKLFWKKYKDIKNLENEFGANVDMQDFKKRITELYSNYSEENKEFAIKNILETTKFNIVIMNILITKSEIDSTYPKIKEIITACEKFHEEERESEK